MRGFAIWLATALAVHAGFVPPDEGRAPFRREALPVDSTTLGLLSTELVAQLPSENEGPSTLRRAAQILGLALALDPGNRLARDWITKLGDGEELPTGDPPGFSARGVEAAQWLASPEAGEQAAVFIGYLHDVLRDEAGTEEADWTGWVAATNAFEDPPDAEEEIGPPEEKSQAPTGPVPKLARIGIRVPVQWGGDHGVTLLTLNLHAYAAPEGEPSPVLLKIPAMIQKKPGPLQAQARQWIDGHFGKTGKPPVRFDYSVAEATTLQPRSTAAVPAAALLLAHAAFAGHEIEAADAVVLAAVAADGSLTTPPLFWDILRGLPDGGGARLIVPAAAAEMLPAMLTLDRSEFFLEHQVLTANSLEEAVALAGGQEVPGLAEAETLFHDVREGKGTRSAGSYFALNATRQKLLRAASLHPAHASARLLALRGTSQWPRRLSREMYAREIRAAVMSLESALSAVWTDEDFDLRSLLEADARCREKLAVIENLCESVEYRDELHNLAFNTSKSLGTLAGQIRRNERDSVYAGGSASQFARPVYRAFREAVITLTAAAGDGDDFPLPQKR